jgi:hypothetical protein
MDPSRVPKIRIKVVAEHWALAALIANRNHLRREDDRQDPYNRPAVRTVHRRHHGRARQGLCSALVVGAPAQSALDNDHGHRISKIPRPIVQRGGIFGRLLRSPSLTPCRFGGFSMTAAAADSQLFIRVDAALRAHPHLRHAQIRSAPSAAGIVLCGRVDSWFQKQMAQEALRQFTEIAAIDNQLIVETPMLLSGGPSMTAALAST